MSTYQKWVDEIVGKLEARRNYYGSVLVESAIVRSDGIWENIITKSLPLHKPDSYIVREKLDYGDFVLFEVLISLDDLIGIVKSLSEKGISTIALGNYEVKVEVEGVSGGHKYDSGREYLNVGWYFEKYQFRSPRKSFHREPIVSKILPLFPDFSSAINERMGIDIVRYSDLSGVVVCLPNYSARIEEVNIGSTEIRLRIHCKATPIENMLGKLYCERGKERRHIDVEFEDGTGTASIGFKPDTLHVVLLSKIDNGILDVREYHSSWDRLPKGVVIEIPEYEIRGLIRNGETETVEFKERIGKTEEFVETFVAFANTRGGVILLGVDNHSRIVGLSEKDRQERITNILRSHCIPQVKCEMREMQLGDNNVMIIRVEEGKDKPYFVRERGPYVRTNATDRIATRYEMDEMYRHKQSGYGSPLYR